MQLVYQYIIEQYERLFLIEEKDRGLLCFFLNTMLVPEGNVRIKDFLPFSKVKMSYFLESLIVIREVQPYHVVHEEDKAIIQKEYTVSNEIFSNPIDKTKELKILLKLDSKMDEHLYKSALDQFDNYIYTGDYLFEKRASTIICDIIEILLTIREKQLNYDIDNLLHSCINIIIAQLGDVDVEKEKHSFFLEEATPTQTLFWDEGDIRKSILLLKQGIFDNYPLYTELGHLISRHTLLISNLSKVEKNFFSAKTGILGVVCGFNRLYDITGNHDFSKESRRWTDILETEMERAVETEQKLDVKSLVDIGLSYAYIKNKKWNTSKNLYQT